MRNLYYDGPPSDHFDGVRFFHPGLPSSDKSVIDVLKWKLFDKSTPWPKVIPAVSGVRPAARFARLRITHIGHASYLIQANGLNILVDPVWAHRASPLKWMGPQRHNPPAIAFEDLPPVDAVLVSHNHYDHMDLSTLHKLWKQHRPRIFAPLGNDVIIRAGAPEIAVQTGDWWAQFVLGHEFRLTIVPAYHWSSRGLRDNRMALWGGFVLESPAGVIYCAGDTAYRSDAIFHEIGRRFHAPDVAIVPIGAYAPRWFMQTQHSDPDEAIQIAEDCGAKQVLGIHWGTFNLTDEPFDEPARRFEAAGRSQGRMKALRPGDVWEPA